MLRKDGTLWLNLGDTYSGGGGGNYGDSKSTRTHRSHLTNVRNRPMPGLKPKDLVGIPWMVAFALRSRGWYLRAAIPWVKRNCMPSPVRDRPVTGTETIFLFAHPDSKGRYFYDVEATRTPTRARRDTDFFFDSLDAIRERKGQMLLHADDGEAASGTIDTDHPTPLALTVNPRPFKQAHFAVFPPLLVEPMIKAGTSEHGCCAECGAPWKRSVKRTGGTWGARKAAGYPNEIKGNAAALKTQRGVHLGTSDAVTLGWEPTCAHADAERVPCTVLDPFGGAGTVALVANQLGRRALYIDTAETYQEMAVSRVEQELAL